MSPELIRPVLAEELPAVLSFWKEAEVTPPSVTDSIEGLTNLMRQPAALFLVATIDGKIVGSVIGGWDGWRGNIYRLAVAPALRRKGIARRPPVPSSSCRTAGGRAGVRVDSRGSRRAFFARGCARRIASV